MMRLAHVLMVLLPVLYLTEAAIYAMAFGGPRAPDPSRARRAFTALLLLVHGLFIGLLWAHLGHLPASDPWLVPSLVAFALFCVYLPVAAVTKTPQTGGFVVGACFALQLTSSAMTVLPPRDSPLLENPVFAIHVTIGIFAFAALLLSGFYGWLYLLLWRQISNKRFGALYRTLPDLQSLSRLNRGSATVGFILLTVGLNLALAWTHAQEGRTVNYLDPKILMLMVTWIFFGLIAASRWIHFLSGRRAAEFAVAGFLLVLLSLVLVSVPLGTLHL